MGVNFEVKSRREFFTGMLGIIPAVQIKKPEPTKTWKMFRLRFKGLNHYDGDGEWSAWTLQTKGYDDSYLAWAKTIPGYCGIQWKEVREVSLA